MELPVSAVLHYQLIEKLGSGGMGDIYKAQDTRLNRYVAIKVLPPSQSGNPERQRRFMQEAQAASALNHPNIVTVHNIIQEGDTLYIVMEYIAGKTLLEIIPEGGLRISQVLRSASQMAGALSAAHAAGIIHRDLKPANIMVTESGLVKVLDFGLAKWTGQTAPVGAPAAAAASANGHAADQTTILESPLTMEGSIMGTLNYMAPEQAEGKRVDARADIFSFGAVLYEMTTGRKAFNGDSAVATLSSVLRDEVPPISGLVPGVPHELEEIIGRCLRKAPQARWQTMEEVAVALGDLRRKSDAAAHPSPQPAVSVVSPTNGRPPGNSSKRLIAVGSGVAVLVAAMLAGWWWNSERHRNGPSNVTAVTPPSSITTPPAAASPAAVPAPADSALTNADIVEMIQAQVPIQAILDKIRSSKTNFNLASGEVIVLTAARVPADVIAAMRNPKGTSAPIPSAAAVQQVAKLPPPSPLAANGSIAGSPSAAVAPTVSSTTPENKASPQLVSVKLNDALPFRVVLTEDVPTDAGENQALSFRVAEDLQVGDTVVIAKGTTVTGEVIGEVGKKKFLGIGGASKMSFRLLSAESVENEKIRVRAVPSVKGDGLTSRPFDTGKGPRPKDLAAARGTEYIAYIDGAQAVSVHK